MARMGDFRKKIKSLIHRYYSWLTLISVANKDEYESGYAKIDVITDQVNSVLPDRPSNFSPVHKKINPYWSMILKSTGHFRSQ